MSSVEELTASNSYIEAELQTRLKAIEDYIDADVVTLIHPIMPPFDDFIRDQIEDIKPKRANLLVILETEGGSIETTERIADVFRHHYTGEVWFLVPNMAMSAGTILVMSGDKIYMDYYSVLGPIDPQVRGSDGQFVPALGYLDKYNQLVEKSKKGGLTQAELAFFLDKFDPAQLHRLEQAREHSVDLLKRWLVKYKFKNWSVTATRAVTVTAKMKTDRAAKIATTLNETRRWRSHGRGISIQVIRETLNLVVEDFGQDDELNKRVRSHYRLLQDYMGRMSRNFAVQTRERLFSM